MALAGMDPARLDESPAPPAALEMVRPEAVIVDASVVDASGPTSQTMVDALRQQLPGLPAGSAKETVDAACGELGVDATGSLVERARLCYAQVT